LYVGSLIQPQQIISKNARFSRATRHLPHA
jgi:hypothetical protein